MSIIFLPHTNEWVLKYSRLPWVVTKPFRIHLARIFWRNTVKAGWGGQRKTEMGYWRMVQKLKNLALVFSLEIFLLMHLTILEESEQKYMYVSLFHIWLGSLNIRSRLHTTLCGNQAFTSTVLSTDRALRTSLFCKYVCFHISYTWYLPPHFIHVCIFVLLIPLACIYWSILGTENTTVSESQKSTYCAAFPFWEILEDACIVSFCFPSPWRDNRIELLAT